MKKKTHVMAIIFFLSFLPILSGCIEENEGEDFGFMTIDGEKKHLSDYRGKVVILDLMGVTCTPCQYQLLELEKVSENYSANDVAIISIDVWTTVAGETAQDVKNLIQAFNQYGINLNWTFGIDDGTIWKEYVISGSVPTIHIFDKKGRVHFSHKGITVFSEVLAPKIDDLL